MCRHKYEFVHMGAPSAERDVCLGVRLFSVRKFVNISTDEL